MFIIPCKFFPEKAIIFECVSRIRKFHEEEIVIVDSCSDTKEYLDIIKNNHKNIYIEDFGNINYEIGALKIAYSKYKFKKYYLLHDSMLLNSPLEDLLDHDLFSTRYFNSWNGVGGANIVCLGKNTPEYHYGYDTIEQQEIVHSWNTNVLKYKIPYIFKGVFGSSFCASKEILDNLSSEGIFENLPKNKLESQAMERYLGIFLDKFNIKHYLKSPLGEHHSHRLESKYITKIILGRQ